jgi:topoisomerase-4 subunit A
VIKDGLPWETDVHEILSYNSAKVVEYLKRELEIERDRLMEKMFYKTLERIFIENRLYKKIETVKTLEKIHETLDESLKPFRKKLIREPTHEDREKLLQIPIRRISQFDIDKNKEEIEILEEGTREVEKNLKNVKKFAIEHLKKIILKFGKDYPRKTRVKAIEEIDRRAIETKEIKVGIDLETGFAGTKVSGSTHFSCTNFDKLLVFSKDGTYKVTNIPEKQYYEGLILAGVADKKTVVNVVGKSKESGQVWAKRFIIDKFILDKTYRFLDETMELELISTDPDAAIELQFTSAKAKKETFALKDIPVKGAQTRGLRLSTQKVKKVLPK